MKKIPPRKPNPELYDRKVEQLEHYALQEEEGLIDIFFFDESGFSISSNAPYTWSPINNTTKIKTLIIKRINVAGFLSKNSTLKAYIADGKIDSEKVIEIFDKFTKSLIKPTVVVLDNASFHKSKKFKANLTKWYKLGLTVFYLPPYSPQLNLIETLWRFMKYTWIEYKAYLSFDNLKQYIQKVFDNYGSKYLIDFGISSY